MNFEGTLKKMIEAAAGAAKIHWKDFRTYAEQEFKRLAEAGAWLEADYIADVAAAERQKKAANREKLKRKAKLRAELAFDSLRLASEGVVTAAKAGREDCRTRCHQCRAGGAADSRERIGGHCTAVIVRAAKQLFAQLNWPIVLPKRPSKS